MVAHINMYIYILFIFVYVFKVYLLQFVDLDLSCADLVKSTRQVSTNNNR